MKVSTKDVLELDEGDFMVTCISIVDKFVYVCTSEHTFVVNLQFYSVFYVDWELSTADRVLKSTSLPRVVEYSSFRRSAVLVAGCQCLLTLKLQKPLPPHTR